MAVHPYQNDRSGKCNNTEQGKTAQRNRARNKTDIRIERMQNQENEEHQGEYNTDMWKNAPEHIDYPSDPNFRSCSAGEPSYSVTRIISGSFLSALWLVIISPLNAMTLESPPSRL